MMRRAIRFLFSDLAAGTLLFIATLLAIIVCHSVYKPLYHHVLYQDFSLALPMITVKKPALLWINDGLMALFFLYVSLEIKQEFLIGSLAHRQQAILPGIAALGGMVLPALIYLSINHHQPDHHIGWAIPTATDIAFSLAILALLGRHFPKPLKIFVTALAIFDDVGAIAIIAVFYTASLSLPLLLAALALWLLLLGLNRLGIISLWPYCIIGFFLWLCILKSGVHATIAGILLGSVIPLNHSEHSTPPLERCMHALHPWVNLLILPLFAFANAGVTLGKLGWQDLLHPIPLGIALGLVIGKQWGIFSFTYLAIRFKWAKAPEQLSWPTLYGLASVAGIGFTMSLFIGSLAFGIEVNQYTDWVRLGIIVGSALSGLMGFGILKIMFRRKRSESIASQH